LGALTVTGGDQSVGPPRCVPHSRDLRRLIREQVPDLTLGAWVNPFRDPAEQVDLLLDPDFHADYVLTQVVSHLQIEPLERFLATAARRGVGIPIVVGVFFYRSGSPRTLERLGKFIPVPAEGLKEEFDRGETPESVCARTLTALRELGVEKVYVSNLEPRRAEERLRRIETLV
jgi:5,10-methylenetetrahydrofolate reductase